MSTIRIPVPRPVAENDDAPARGGAQDEELRESCRATGIDLPELWVVHTVEVAKRAWGLRRANLRGCAYLDIPLKHHDALPDAEACARIVLAAGPGWARRVARRIR